MMTDFDSQRSILPTRCTQTSPGERILHVQLAIVRVKYANAIATTVATKCSTVISISGRKQWLTGKTACTDQAMTV
jgi:hypothetical protein